MPAIALKWVLPLVAVAGAFVAEKVGDVYNLERGHSQTGSLGYTSPDGAGGVTLLGAALVGVAVYYAVKK